MLFFRQGDHNQKPTPRLGCPPKLPIDMDFTANLHLARTSGGIIITRLESQAAQLEQEILQLEQRLWRLRSEKARSALRDSDTPNYLNSPKRSAPPPVHRRYSADSQAALNELAAISDEAGRLQGLSEKAEAQLRLAERYGEELDRSLRSSLAQLYGDATRLVERGLDSIQTVDLVSGRQDAREARKALVGRLEDLAMRAKSQLERCDKLMDAQHSALANDAEELD